MTHIAVKDFSYRENKWTKGDEVRASSSLIAMFKAKGYITTKKQEVIKPKEVKEAQKGK